MNPTDLEARVAALEAELARLKGLVEKPAEAGTSFVMKYAGSWANDPIYDEAMRLGREYRESLRPKTLLSGVTVDGSGILSALRSSRGRG